MNETAGNISDTSQEPRFLVPMALEALVVDSRGNSAQYANLTPKYDLINYGVVLGEKIIGSVFTTSGGPEPGVHLHWALPDALTHGLENQNGDIEFPAVPNRWFVLRIRTDKQGTADPETSFKAWIVESDYHFYQDWPDGVTSISIPSRPSDKDPLSFLYLGRSTEYSKWKEASPGSYLSKLTAVGPGDPAFAAYYPNCKSVFGFHDSLSDFTDGNFTYMVFGWFSNPEHDPLHRVQGQDWTDRLKELKWSVASGSSAQPDLILCHGMVFGIPWKGKDGQYKSGVPSEPVNVTVGNTSIEALSALLSSKLPADANVERILQAFQYGVISEWGDPDGIMLVEEKIHENAFGALKGGIRWSIGKTAGNADSVDKRQSTAPFSDGMGKALDRLNKAQNDLEQLEREMKAYQWELYSTWYKYMMNTMAPMTPGAGGPGPAGPPVPETGGNSSVSNIAILNAISQLEEKIADPATGLKKKIGAASAALDKQKTDLVNSITQNMPGYELKEFSAPRFWEPSDPVALLSGTGVQRSLKHGCDGRFSKDNTLHCRTSGQIVGSLAVNTGGGNIDVTRNNLLGLYPQFPSGPPVPRDIESLVVEGILLDTSEAGIIALAAFKAAGTPNPSPPQISRTAQSIIKKQTVPLNALIHNDLDYQTLASSAGFNGAFPSKISFAQWTQPWTPLFMEWEIGMTPSWDTSDPGAALDGWQESDIDFQWTSASLPQNMAHQFHGSVLLAPHAPINLKNAILNFVEKHKHDITDTGVLKDIAEATAGLNILSQTLSGFNDSLLMRKQTLQFPVFDFSIGNPELAEKVAGLVGDMTGTAPFPDGAFFPLRAGFAQILKLWIVDAFGRIQKVTVNPPYSATTENMTTVGSGFDHFFTLRPRLPQPSRLSFRWVSAEGNAVEMNSDPATSAICGWILPNHLDRSIMVYGGSGEPLGEVRETGDPSAASVRWDPAPDTVTSAGKPGDIPNTQLRGFVKALLDCGADGIPALSELLANIDETMWSVDPLGARRHQGLSVLIGRPLALARASIKLELDGPPAWNQNKDVKGKYLSGGIEKIQFPVRLGDIRKIRDGLIGYFPYDAGNTYNTFHVAHQKTPGENDSRYIKHNHVINLTLDPAEAPTILTLIVDPRAEVHATSCMLPAKSIQLPDEYLANALAAMNVTFQVAPLVGKGPVPDIPLPNTDVGEWSWLYRTAPGPWQENRQIRTPDSKAHLSPAPGHISEGWLKLSGATGEGE